MKDTKQDYIDELEKSGSEEDKMDFALHEMEMLCKSRCADVPLTTSVKVVDVEKEKKDK